MKKTLPIMIQGTNSDAGKSMLVTAFCRIFTQDGYKTAPFKSQNMALNSYITVDGYEIGRAQGVQAEAAGITATTDMNPILIKPSSENDSQIVVKGKPYKNMKGMRYREEFYEKGLALIKESYQNLASQYERIVIEGAGSPAEVNLNDRELVNMRVARITNAPVIIVGDIEKGGVFASLVGTLQLLPEEDKQRVIGVIINKFWGDLSLLQSGLDWFEEYTGLPVFGVVPFLPNLNIEAEDSVILDSYRTVHDTSKDIDIAVIRYPKISNFTDVDPFFSEADCSVRFVSRGDQLKEPDLVILPGSKNTIEDLLFLENSGLKKKILELQHCGKAVIFGICGGYQMLGEEIQDPHHVESELERVDGLGLLPLNTVMTEEKTTIQSQGILIYDGKQFSIKGYEIHMGQTSLTEAAATPFIQKDNGSEGCKAKGEQVLGTYFHGIFHNDEFRSYLLNKIRKNKGLPPIEERIAFNQLREESFDLLAEHVRKHVKIDDIIAKMKEFQKD